MFLKAILLSIMISFTAAAKFEEAKQIPHLRAFIYNIEWLMRHIVEDVDNEGCPGSDKQYVSATDITPYRQIGTPDRYYSSALLKTTCDIQLTLNTSVTGVVVPGFVLKDISQEGDAQKRKILLKREAVGGTGYHYWECKTNIDAPQFQGESIAANQASIISYFSDNVFVGNCVYVAAPF